MQETDKRGKQNYYADWRKTYCRRDKGGMEGGVDDELYLGCDPAKLPWQ